MGHCIGHCPECSPEGIMDKNSPFKNVPKKLIAKFRKLHKWTNIASITAILLFILSVILCVLYPCKFFVLTSAVLYTILLLGIEMHLYLDGRSVKKMLSYLDKPSNEFTPVEQFKHLKELDKILGERRSRDTKKE